MKTLAGTPIVSLNEDNFKEYIENKDGLILVDFWAPWCGPCRQLGPILEEIATENLNKVTVVKVNVDENPKLAMEYQIRSIPAVKFLINGNQVLEQVGAHPKKQWIDWINQLTNDY